jgi:serine/threonine protein kinase
MAKMSWIGQSLSGRYQIEELLGQGGMSAVYKATDPNLRRVVAIKLIHSHLSDHQDFVRRFEEEAAAVAQLRHTNIVQVYDFNHDGGSYYMVLEFIPGETLQDRLKRLNKSGRTLPLEDGLRYMAQVCDAVDYAHQRGMIHRDIKPANIMLSVYQTAVLMDFGIAKIMGGTQHTATGAVVGTAMYMSPEQIQGERLDERTDIYSLGVTLFEMLSGRPPFEADSAMTLMMMHINDPVPDIRTLKPDVPEEVVAILNKALAKKRFNRYASTTELAQDLRRVLARLEGQGEPEHMPEKPTPATLIEPAVRESVDSTAVSEAVLPDPQPSTAVEPEKVLPVQAKPPATQSEPIRTQTEPPATIAEPVRTQIESPATIAEPARTHIEPHIAQDAGMATQMGAGPSLQNAATAYQPAVSGSFQPAAAVPAAPTSPGRKLPLPLPVLAGGGIGLLLLVVVLVIVLSNGGGGGSAAIGQVDTPTATEEPLPVVVELPTETPSPTPTQTLVPTATNTSYPTLTPTITLTPTVTVPPGIPYVRINDITVKDGYFVVEYETFEYTEVLPGMHVHFFFNTVTQDNAGSPGSGPWKLYGGPRPFQQYRVTDRPANATRMCALVANPNHSIQRDSGNCFDLPEG